MGPVFVFFLLEPGALLVDRADSSDAIASITALASNAALAHLVAFVVPLGLILALYGLHVLQTGVRDGGSGDALSRLGLLFITIASIGWVLTYGLTHVMANAPAQALQAMVPVFSIESGITNVSSPSAALGVVLFGLGLSTREDVNKIAAFAVVVVAIVALVCLVISSNADVRNVMTTIARVCYLVWAIWFVSLGVGLLKKA